MRVPCARADFLSRIDRFTDAAAHYIDAGVLIIEPLFAERQDHPKKRYAGG
jgi:hypothetical protein